MVENCLAFRTMPLTVFPAVKTVLWTGVIIACRDDSMKLSRSWRTEITWTMMMATAARMKNAIAVERLFR
jgi:hypothetical protein